MIYFVYSRLTKKAFFLILFIKVCAWWKVMLFILFMFPDINLKVAVCLAFLLSCILQQNEAKYKESSVIQHLISQK